MDISTRKVYTVLNKGEDEHSTKPTSLRALKIKCNSKVKIRILDVPGLYLKQRQQFWTQSVFWRGRSPKACIYQHLLNCASVSLHKFLTPGEKIHQEVSERHGQGTPIVSHDPLSLGCVDCCVKHIIVSIRHRRVGSEMLTQNSFKLHKPFYNIVSSQADSYIYCSNIFITSFLIFL